MQPQRPAEAVEDLGGVVREVAQQPRLPGVRRVDLVEGVPELLQRADGDVVEDEHQGGHDAADGEPDQGAEGAPPAADQQRPDERGADGAEEHRLPGERRQRDRDAGPSPAAVDHGPQGERHQQHHRGLLAGAAGGVGDEPLEGEQAGGGGDAGDAGVEGVAGQQVDHPHGDHREQQHQDPHRQQVVGAGVGAEQPPHPGRDTGHHVGERAGPVEDGDEGRDPLGELLPAVRVEREVAGQDAAEAVQQEHDGSHGPQEGAERVDATEPAGNALQSVRHAGQRRAVGGRLVGPGHASTRSTTTGAWSEAPVPARSSRSMKAPVTRPASAGEASTKSIRSPRFALEALPVVVPVGVDARPGGVGSYDVDVTVVEERLEGGPLGRRHVRGLRELCRVEDVLVGRADVPVADQGRGLVPPRPGRLPQPRHPVELVDVVRVVGLAAVGDVERPHPDAAARRSDGA